MLSLFLLLVSITLLSLGMNKHYKTTFNKPLPDALSKKLRFGGWLSLILSVIAVTPSSVNYVNWLTQLSLVIIFQAWFLTKIQRHRKK